MAPTAAEASVASIRDQVQSLVSRHHRSGSVAGRVQVRRLVRPTPSWRITARIEGSYLRRAPNLSFSHEQVELGDSRIVVPEPDIVIIFGAGFKDGTLTLRLRMVR